MEPIKKNKVTVFGDGTTSLLSDNIDWESEATYFIGCCIRNVLRCENHSTGNILFVPKEIKKYIVTDVLNSMFPNLEFLYQSRTRLSIKIKNHLRLWFEQDQEMWSSKLLDEITQIVWLILDITDIVTIDNPISKLPYIKTIFGNQYSFVVFDNHIEIKGWRRELSS